MNRWIFLCKMGNYDRVCLYQICFYIRYIKADIELYLPFFSKPVWVKVLIHIKKWERWFFAL